MSSARNVLLVSPARVLRHPCREVWKTADERQAIHGMLFLVPCRRDITVKLTGAADSEELLYKL